MNKMTLILSYPRSGNTWVRYIIEALSGRQTIERIEHYDQHIWKKYSEEALKRLSNFRKNISVDEFGLPIACKSHKYLENVNVDSMLFLLRNPGHACISNNLRYKRSDYINRYIDLIHNYHNSDLKKDIIYYEDLLENPKENLLKICNIIGCGHDVVDLFIKDYKEHFEHCVKFYASVNGSFTNGNNDDFYKKYNKEVKNIINCIKNKNSPILNKYLSRYYKDL